MSCGVKNNGFSSSEETRPWSPELPWSPAECQFSTGPRCTAAETVSLANPLEICVSQSKTPSPEVPSSASWFLVLFGFATEKSPTPLSKNEFYNLLSRTYSFYLLLESLSPFFDFSQYRTRLCRFISRVLSILPPQYSFRTSGLVKIPPPGTPLPLSARSSN